MKGPGSEVQGFGQCSRCRFYRGQLRGGECKEAGVFLRSLWREGLQLWCHMVPQFQCGSCKGIYRFVLLLALESHKRDPAYRMEDWSSSKITLQSTGCEEAANYGRESCRAWCVSDRLLQDCAW